MIPEEYKNKMIIKARARKGATGNIIYKCMHDSGQAVNNCAGCRLSARHLTPSG